MFKAGSDWVSSGGNAAQTFRQGNKHRWPEGVSGNPRGLTKTQSRFRQLYVLALAGGSDEELAVRAQELAALAWKAARAGEPWGFQEIRGQLAPLIAAAQIKVTHEVTEDGIDYSKLSDEQLQQLEAILESVQPGAIGSGESPAESA